MKSMFEMKGIDLSFEGRSILSDFSLTVNEGEKVLLYGKSGKGKTSILRLMLGFVQPDRGEMLYRGNTVGSRGIWNIRKETSYIPQNTHMGEESARDIIDFARTLRINRDVCCNDETVNETLDYFHLRNDIVNKPFNDLSGGEKQRVLLTVGLSLNRHMYLLDEPTASLDRAMKEKTVELFVSMKKATVMVVSHDDIWLKDNVFKRVSI